MPWPPSLLGLTLLLPLLLPSWAPTRAANEMAEMTVWAPTEVHGRLGNIVMLPCELQSRGSSTPEVTQVTWTRWAPSGESSILAVLHRLSRPRILEPGHVEFASAWRNPKLQDASLLVHGLRPEDEANYTCEMTVAQGGSRNATTWLRVFYAPQVSISRSDDTGQQGRRETSLNCYARSNPEPKSYDWSTTIGPLPPSAVPHGSQLLIQPTEESINTTFICRVSNDLGIGQAAMRVLIPETREESLSLLAHQIVLWVSVIVFMPVVRALAYYWRRRQFRSLSCVSPRPGDPDPTDMDPEAGAGLPPRGSQDLD